MPRNPATKAEKDVSPKVIAATVAALVAPIIVGFVADKLGTDLDISLVEAAVGTLVIGLLTFVAGYVKRDPVRSRRES